MRLGHDSRVEKAKEKETKNEKILEYLAFTNLRYTRSMNSVALIGMYITCMNLPFVL